MALPIRMEIHFFFALSMQLNLGRYIAVEDSLWRDNNIIEQQQQRGYEAAAEMTIAATITEIDVQCLMKMKSKEMQSKRFCKRKALIVKTKRPPNLITKRTEMTCQMTAFGVSILRVF